MLASPTNILKQAIICGTLIPLDMPAENHDLMEINFLIFARSFLQVNVDSSGKPARSYSYNIHMRTSLKERIYMHAWTLQTSSYTKSTKICHNQVAT